ncbi:unnamed protein product [Rotaria sordida]|uniref:Uncharacterized protein n=1 Tax=Rotaria sordida TaxID=392033 RepID=A0A818YGP3_9BILA|nr:unnamed protein product [Rotaria sordida]
MNCNNWNKCTGVRYRLSSRVNNEYNQSAIIDNCDTKIPLCVEKSFYQCKNDVGQECCVEVCGNCCDPIKLSNSGFVKNMNINNSVKSTCNTKINLSCSTPTDSYRNQFALSNIFDNKHKYIDYIVTNVLRQVVNHISLDTLHQLSYSLPQNIERILCHVTDIDSDRLIRILVTEVLKCYCMNAGHLTDWYAFANSIKSFLSSTKVLQDDNDNQKTDDTRNQTSSFVKKEKRLQNNAFKKIVTPSKDAKIPFINRTSSNETISETNSMTPMGTQSKTKSKQNIVVDKNKKIDHHESLPFRKKSTNRSQIQHQLSSNSYHYNHESDKNSNRSLSRNSIRLPIHHKHKHRNVYNHHTTTSFDTPSSSSLSSNMSASTKELIQNYKQTSIENNNLNSTKTKQIKSSDHLTQEQMLVFKRMKSSDKTAKHYHQIKIPSVELSLHDRTISSTNSQHQISCLRNEIEMNQDSIADNHQLSSSKDLNKSNILLNNNQVRSNTNSISKNIRINHYPNMLADFD